MATISRRHVLKFAGVAAIATALPPTLDSSRAGAQDVVTTPDGFVVVRDEGALSLSPSAAPISYYAASMGGDAAVTVDVEAVGSTAQTSLSRIGLDGTSSSATGALQSIVPSTIDVAETTPLVHVSIAQNTGVAAALTQVNVSAAATGNSGDDPTSAAASQYTLQQKAMDPWQLLVSPPALPPGVTAVTTPLVPPAADIRPGVSYVFADLFGVNPPCSAILGTSGQLP